MGINHSNHGPRSEIKTEVIHNKKYIAASSCMQGWRDYMEDTHTILPSLPEEENTSFFGVYDGHNGVKIAMYAHLYLHGKISEQAVYVDGDIKSAIQKSFLKLDEEMMIRYYGHSSAGCTAICIFIKDNVLYCSNLGDSRAIASINGSCVPLSTDHKPTLKEEFERIYEAGGTVDCDRVNGRLALSRAFGDFEFKNNTKLRPEKQIVTAFPEINIKQNLKEFEFVILASDGLWDVLSNEEVVTFVQNCIAVSMKPEEICEMLISSCLAPDTTLMGLGCDNITVILICFQNNDNYSTLVSRCKHIISQK